MLFIAIFMLSNTGRDHHVHLYTHYLIPHRPGTVCLYFNTYIYIYILIYILSIYFNECKG